MYDLSTREYLNDRTRLTCRATLTLIMVTKSEAKEVIASGAPRAFVGPGKNEKTGH